jgi:uncharacterized protein (DUF305 family)
MATESMHEAGNHYMRLAMMTAASFVAMFVLMYAMVNRTNNVYVNVNQFYMAGLMTAAMVLIELALMRSMYRNHRLNGAILLASVLALIAFWFGVRQQVGVSDKQFLKSMIPHHGAAILMCEQASIRDPEVARLCRQIITNQTSEISQMKRILTASRQ